MEDLDELEPEGGCFCYPSAHTGQIVVKPEPHGLASARRAILSVAKELALDDDDTMDILIAVGEALSNAYRHGTTDPNSDLIHVSWHFANNIITVAVKDGGPGCCLHETTPDEKQTNSACGYGIRLMRKCVDDVRFEWNDGGKVVLTKRLHTKNLHEVQPATYTSIDRNKNNNEEGSSLPKTVLDSITNKHHKLDSPGQISREEKDVAEI